MIPEIPPIYMIPGIPRLRFPLFSVMISPVEPKSRGMPWIIAALMKEAIVDSIYFPSLCFARVLLIS